MEKIMDVLTSQVIKREENAIKMINKQWSINNLYGKHESCEVGQENIDIDTARTEKARRPKTN